MEGALLVSVEVEECVHDLPACSYGLLCNMCVMVLLSTSDQSLPSSSVQEETGHNLHLAIACVQQRAEGMTCMYSEPEVASMA